MNYFCEFFYGSCKNTYFFFYLSFHVRNLPRILSKVLNMGERVVFWNMIPNAREKTYPSPHPYYHNPNLQIISAAITNRSSHS